MTIDDMNRRNLVISFPCEVHSYVSIDKETKECIECKMVARRYYDA